MNGAGKTALRHILSGAIQPDGGCSGAGGRRTPISNPWAAQALGTATVFQDPDLVPNLSEAENVLSNRHPVRLGIIDVALPDHQARAVPEELGAALKIDLVWRPRGRSRASSLSTTRCKHGTTRSKGHDTLTRR